MGIEFALFGPLNEDVIVAVGAVRSLVIEADAEVFPLSAASLAELAGRLKLTVPSAVGVTIT